MSTPEPELFPLPPDVTAREPNPMVRGYGLGPDGARCKTCRYLYARRFANTYYKCELRSFTQGPATDHRVGWRACAKYVAAP